jgi:protein-S-isoprenylcysteine O-methyltransferase Ste14
MQAMEPADINRERGRSRLIVLFAILGTAAFVLFLMIITGWSPLWMLAVAVAFGVVGLLHYLIWGRRLEQAVPPELRADQATRPWRFGGPYGPHRDQR